MMPPQNSTCAHNRTGNASNIDSQLDRPITLIDSHVHVYPCFHVSELLDAAWRNAQKQAKLLKTNAFQLVLCLTETAACDFFSSLQPFGKRIGDWQSMATEEPQSCLLTNSEGAQIVLIAGRQVATVEKLEVLVLGCRYSLADGLTLQQTLREIQQKQGYAILPWAVGKWLGKRGGLITEALADSQVLLADNSGRPWCWPTPAVFAQAHRAEKKLLRGTDPLPLCGEEAIVASFGNYMAGIWSTSHPTQQLQQVLFDTQTELFPYGRLESLSRFIRNQGRLRL